MVRNQDYYELNMALIVHLIWAHMGSEKCFWVWIWIQTWLLKAFGAILPYSLSATANNVSLKVSHFHVVFFLLRVAFSLIGIIAL